MDFEAMIRAAMKEGKSLEDIASEVGKTLNKVQDETKEKGRKVQCLNDWKEIFNEHYTSGKLDLSDVAALAVIVCEPDYPNWAYEDLMKLFKQIKEAIKLHADMQGKGVKEVFAQLNNTVDDLLGTIDKKCSGTYHKESDVDRIKRFLDKL